MTILDELKDYLSIKNPSGAIMVTGKWGCGKTYLIDHDLREAIKENCIILKVSLFGITDTEAVNHIIKKRWADVWLDHLAGDGAADTGNKIVNYLRNLPLPHNVKSVVNVDPVEFVQIKNIIDNKKVVLVFDDLERCRMNIVDILGCINSYCENQGFHTIIIANEERIHDTKSGEANTNDLNDTNTQLLYKEIKEKIILRTLYYKPDYELIIENIINKIKPQYENSDKDSYKMYAIFISQNSKRIASLIDNAEYIFKNNIRCINCSLQDFLRVYCLLYDNGIKGIENWLAPFFLFEAAVRNGLIQYNGREQAVNDIQELAKNDFNDKYFIHGIVEWVFNGVWDSSAIDKEIAHFKEIQGLDNDYDKLRLGSVLTLEDNVISGNLDTLIQNACSGDISLDDYLNLLHNFALLRSVKHPKGENQDKIRQIENGLNKCFERIEKGEIEDKCTIECAELLNNEALRRPERRIVNSIDSYRIRRNREQMILQNEYCDIISKELTYLKNNHMGMKFSKITKEMATETYKAFYSASNEEKYGFSSVFKSIFIGLSENGENYSNLNLLKRDLSQLLISYNEQNMQIAADHTRQLRNAVEDLMR